MIFDVVSAKEATIDIMNIDSFKQVEEVKKDLYEGYLDEEIRQERKNKLDKAI